MLYRSTGTCAEPGPGDGEDPNLPIHLEAVKSNSQDSDDGSTGDRGPRRLCGPIPCRRVPATVALRGVSYWCDQVPDMACDAKQVILEYDTPREATSGGGTRAEAAPGGTNNSL